MSLLLSATSGLGHLDVASSLAYLYDLQSELKSLPKLMGLKEDLTIDIVDSWNHKKITASYESTLPGYGFEKDILTLLHLAYETKPSVFGGEVFDLANQFVSLRFSAEKNTLKMDSSKRGMSLSKIEEEAVEILATAFLYKKAGLPEIFTIGPIIKGGVCTSSTAYLLTPLYTVTGPNDLEMTTLNNACFLSSLTSTHLTIADFTKILFEETVSLASKSEMLHRLAPTEMSIISKR